jgi:hypothetical protein
MNLPVRGQSLGADNLKGDRSDVSLDHFLGSHHHHRRALELFDLVMAIEHP